MIPTGIGDLAKQIIEQFKKEFEYAKSIFYQRNRHAGARAVD